MYIDFKNISKALIGNSKITKIICNGTVLYQDIANPILYGVNTKKAFVVYKNPEKCLVDEINLNIDNGTEIIPIYERSEG